MPSRQIKWLKTLKGISYTKKYLVETKEKRLKKAKIYREKKKKEVPEYYKKNYQKYKMIRYAKKYRATGIRKWTKKGKCPFCGNKTGSYHNKKCLLAFIIPTKEIKRLKKLTN